MNLKTIVMYTAGKEYYTKMNKYVIGEKVQLTKRTSRRKY